MIYCWCWGFAAVELGQRYRKLCWFKLAGITCYPHFCSANEWMACESLRPLCTSNLRRSAFWHSLSFSESLHDRRGKAVQSFPAQPLCRAPSGPGPPAVPGRRLDPVQGSGAGGAAKTQRPLQQEIVLGTPEVSKTLANRGVSPAQWYESSDLHV